MVKPKRETENKNPELRPDGWERFRSAVHAAAKSGPKHRKAEDKPKSEKKPAKAPR
jgi:hypothetical protein